MKDLILLFVYHPISAIKSLFINLLIFGLNGYKIPIVFSSKIKVKNAKRGCVKLSKLKSCVVNIGFGGISSVPSSTSMIDFCNGTISFKGSASFSEGVTMKNKGELTFGDGFSANKNCRFSCTTKMTFGDKCLLGWNIHLRDSDGHIILKDNIPSPTTLPVIIGNHVWIASECHILKGSQIPDDCILGYGSLLNRKIKESNSLIAGQPADIVKRNISWVL